MPVPVAAIATKAAVSFASSPRGRAIIVATVSVVAVTLLGGLLLMGGIIGAASSMFTEATDAGQAADTCYNTGSDGSTPTPGATTPGLTTDQTANAQTIVNVAKSIPMPADVDNDTNRQFAAQVAIATALVEAGLGNPPDGDLDSAGAFQQRPSQGWGTHEQVTDVTYAASAFLLGVDSTHVPGLVDIAGWATLPLGNDAQAVQRSALPGKYALKADQAAQIVSTLWPAATTVTIPPELIPTTFNVGDVQIPGGSTACNTDVQLPTGTVVLGEWGGYPNGQIPPGALCVIPWATDTDNLLRCDAVQALTALNAKYKADHGGANIGINDAYRDLAGQIAARADWCAKGNCLNAAIPGQSNHGWGLAVDFANFGDLSQYDTPNYLWMKANAAAFGFTHPAAMEPGGDGPHEPWHWEYTGTPLLNPLVTP